MKKSLTLILLFPVIPGCLFAQSKTGNIAGKVMEQTNSLTYMGVGGAVVKAITLKDTLHTTTIDGYFQFKKVTAGRVTLRFSHISYKDVIKEIEVKPGQTTEVRITMQEAPQQIDAVTVKGETQVLKISGDTLIYNAAAVRTLEGDETMEIIKQLPGVLADETGVSVMGKNIDRTYIDGKLIFGRDPMAALQNLLANDVLKIRVYDEYADDNPRHKRRKGDEMRRVFNIETKSKLIQATVGHFLASYGADMNKGGHGNHDRYGIGATANFFSENLLLSANAFFNNINRKSNRISDIIAVKSPKSSYDRSTYANVGLERSWKIKDRLDKTYLNASYSYSDDYTRSENSTQQVYFPAKDYTSRTYADTSRNSSTRRTHEANILLDHFYGVRFSHSMRFEDNRTDGLRSYASIVDAAAPAGGRTASRTDKSPYMISDNLAFKVYDFHVSASFDASSNDGRGFRTDTLTSTATRRELRSTSTGLGRKVTAGVTKSIFLSEDISRFIDFRYQFTWEKSKQRQTSLDLADIGNPVIDTTNTYNFTNNYNTHKIEAALLLAFPKIKGNFTFTPALSTTGINRDERFPENDAYNKRFNAFLPSVSFGTQSMMKRFSVAYMTGVQLPSIEQLRPRLDDTNPYMLVAGNQRLKQSYTHYLLGAYTTMFGKANNNLVFRLEAKKTDNVIAYKHTFFTAETYLPEWDYTAPAQSTLTTYENVDGMWTANADIKWIRPLRKIKSQLTVNAIFNYDDTPSFVDDALNRTKSYAPELSLSLRANVSRSFRFTVGSRTSYIYSENNIGQDDKYFQQGASANAELINIFKRFYLNATYSLSYYKRFGGNSYDLNNQILNVAVGCKILKRRGDISFTAYDILNRNSGYKTAMYSDYIQNTWTRSFGRYFTFNIAYKFNKSKSGVTNDAVKDGSVKE